MVGQTFSQMPQAVWQIHRTSGQLVDYPRSKVVKCRVFEIGASQLKSGVTSLINLALSFWHKYSGDMGCFCLFK